MLFKYCIFMPLDPFGKPAFFLLCTFLLSNFVHDIQVKFPANFALVQPNFGHVKSFKDFPVQGQS